MALARGAIPSLIALTPSNQIHSHEARPITFRGRSADARRMDRVGVVLTLEVSVPAGQELYNHYTLGVILL